ncbi:MAG: glycosyltransferase family 2 protein [Acidobacteriota bacterium]
MRHIYALIIPALNEAETLADLLHQIPYGLFSQIIVVDNGSRDSTSAVAAAAGAEVVYEPRRGYGQACASGIQKLQRSITAVGFMDADLSDNPGDLKPMVKCFDDDAWDMVLGSRVLGNPEPGSLTPMQRFGNWLSTSLIALIWHVKFTDLGPMRILRRESLDGLSLRDRSFGWNVEMQARAAQLGLRVREIPVDYRRRLRGRSKISGSVLGSLRAGTKILWTILRCCLAPLASST